MDFIQRFKQIEEKVALILKKISDGSIGGGGSLLWGAITGTLGDQTDLSTALGNKVDLTTYNGFFATLVGAIFPYAGATAPTGFLLCNGSAVSRTTYASLFAIIGTNYGDGNGTTTFNLPDFLGKIPVGKSTDTEFNALGKTGGEKSHTLLTAEMPIHNHTISIADLFNARAGDGGYYNGEFQWNISARRTLSSTNYLDGIVHDTNIMSKPVASNAGSGSTHNNIQPYNTVNYIIKF